MPWQKAMKGKTKFKAETFKTAQRVSSQISTSIPAVSPFEKTLSTTDKILSTPLKTLFAAQKTFCTVDIINHQLREEVNEFVDYLLFVDEAPLTSNIRGSSGFAEKFAALGPVDGKGRSLRQFDLEHRLMRYPCSYMIYAPALRGVACGSEKDDIRQDVRSNIHSVFER